MDASAGAGGRIPRVLVVDDDADLRLLLELALGSAGWEVVTAATEDDALHRIAAHDPDVVLLDLGLSVGDGANVLRRIKSDPFTSWIPVLVVSGRTGSDEQDAMRSAGAHDYLTKPWVRSDLETRLSRALDWSQQQRPLS